MRSRSIMATLVLCAALIPATARAKQPVRPSFARRATGLLKQGVSRGSAMIRKGWTGLQLRRQVNRGFRQVVKEHPDELKPILAEGKTRTRTARRVKWGAATATAVTAAASVAAPILIPVAVGAGAAAYVAKRVEKRGRQRARVQAIKHALLEGYTVPAATEAHYRPLVQKSVLAEIAAARTTAQRGQDRLTRMRPGVLRKQQRARAAVERYRRKKAPFVQLRDRVQGAVTQMQQLGQQLQQLDGTPPGE